MPDLEFQCPNCKETLIAPEELAGKTGTCDGCNTVVTIPSLPNPPSSQPIASSNPQNNTPAKKEGGLWSFLFGDDDTPTKPIDLELLRSLDWKRFEEVVAKLFEMKGYKSNLTPNGADGGVDIYIYKSDNPKPSAVVQCKSWERLVGVKPIRELYGVMAGEHIANGFFATTGTYTDDAVKFAEGKKIKLLTGEDLIERVEKLSAEDHKHLYELATEWDYTTPSCPSCGRKLVKRISKKGRNEGQSFWGCPGYPRCKYKMRLSKKNVKKEDPDIWDVLFGAG